MSALSSHAATVLKDALSLSLDDQREVAARLAHAIAVLESADPIPDWHLAILKTRLAQPDDDHNTVSADEAWSQINRTLRQPRAGT